MEWKFSIYYKGGGIYVLWIFWNKLIIVERRLKIEEKIIYLLFFFMRSLDFIKEYGFYYVFILLYRENYMF